MTSPVERPLTLVCELIDRDGLVPARAVALGGDYRVRVRAQDPAQSDRVAIVIQRDGESCTRPRSFRIERSDGSAVEGEMPYEWALRVCARWVAAGAREELPE